MRFVISNFILFLVTGVLSGISVADESRIQQELTDSIGIIPPLQQALGKEAFDKAMASGEHSYTGNAKCRLCHRDFFLGRKEDVHDHAYEKLLAAGAEYIENPRCLNCHTTGYGVNSGFQNITKTSRLVNVQCEGCHGPGNEHIRRQIVNMPVTGLAGFGSVVEEKAENAPKVILGGFLAGVDNPQILKKMCMSCHTQRWNRSFNDLDKAYNSYKKAKPEMTH
ncbi:MAG: cytochrome c family protein [Gammaproteobacteria bacterium]|nr:cytochrome c family protein [Gammaproteobacteria bacterium]